MTGKGRALHPDALVSTQLVGGGNYFANGVVDFILRREAPEAEANARVRVFVAQANSFEYMAGATVAAGAGRPGESGRLERERGSTPADIFTYGRPTFRLPQTDESALCLWAWGAI